MNAATRPAIGAVRSSSSRRALRSAIPTPAAATTPVADRGRRIEESVGYVHECLPVRSETRLRPAAQPRSLHIIRNKTWHGLAMTDRLAPGDTAPAFTLTRRHRRQGLAQGLHGPEGDRLLLPRRDDPRLHQAGVRLHRQHRLAARRRLRGARHLPGQAREARQVPREGVARHPTPLRPRQVGDGRAGRRTARSSCTARPSRASSARRSWSTSRARSRSRSTTSRPPVTSPSSARIWARDLDEPGARLFAARP